jgi:hypothetical protein
MKKGCRDSRMTLLTNWTPRARMHLEKSTVIAKIFPLFFFFLLWDYRHCGHSWPIVPASGDNEDDYATRSYFTTTFKRARHSSLSRVWWNIVRKLPPYFHKIYFKIILPSTPSSPKVLIFFRFSYQDVQLIPLLSHTCYIPRPSNPPWFNHPNKFCGGEQFTKLLIKQFLRPLVTSRMTL